MLLPGHLGAPVPIVFSWVPIAVSSGAPRVRGVGGWKEGAQGMRAPLPRVGGRVGGHSG